jgi:hypothetical protein
METPIKQLFSWKCEPEAANLAQRLLQECVEKSAFLQKLERDLLTKTSTRLFDWIDHIEVGFSEDICTELEVTGYRAEAAMPMYRIFSHPGAQLPKIVVKDRMQSFLGLAILVENIADFLCVRGITAWIEGSPLSPFRRALVSRDNGIFVYAVERRAGSSMEPITQDEQTVAKIHLAYEKWQTRTRSVEAEDSENDCLQHAISLAGEIVELVGKPMAATIVLDVERKYWQAKNRAGQLQKDRQDSLGMGWANHDHHTFRSSRAHFCSAIRLFEVLGFACRERFYAGEEAGWGAQVMEHPDVRLVLFIDVDLAPDEVAIDFAHIQLPPRNTVGTVGLWCALHGESILQAGMHHLEAQFSFTELTEELKKIGVSMMKPFSDFPYLKQAFTTGETWQVNPKRVQRLLKYGLITKEQADNFLTNGAIGSHLENLQRQEGFKGFNQKNVSDIIHRTDPRSIGA